MVDWLLGDTGGSADTQRCDRDRDRLLAARQDVVQSLELRPPGLHVLEVLSPPPLCNARVGCLPQTGEDLPTAGHGAVVQHEARNPNWLHAMLTPVVSVMNVLALTSACVS